MRGRRTDFFSSQDQVVTFKRIQGKDTRKPKEVFLEVELGLISKSGSSVAANTTVVPSNSLILFFRSVPAELQNGDELALFSTRDPEKFDYFIEDIDTNARGRNAKRYPVRIEAKRRS